MENQRVPIGTTQHIFMMGSFSYASGVHAVGCTQSLRKETDPPPPLPRGVREPPHFFHTFFHYPALTAMAQQHALTHPSTWPEVTSSMNGFPFPQLTHCM